MTTFPIGLPSFFPQTPSFFAFREKLWELTLRVAAYIKRHWPIILCYTLTFALMVALGAPIPLVGLHVIGGFMYSYLIVGGNPIPEDFVSKKVPPSKRRATVQTELTGTAQKRYERLESIKRHLKHCSIILKCPSGCGKTTALLSLFDHFKGHAYWLDTYKLQGEPLKKRLEQIGKHLRCPCILMIDEVDVVPGLLDILKDDNNPLPKGCRFVAATTQEISDISQRSNFMICTLPEHDDTECEAILKASLATDDVTALLNHFKGPTRLREALHLGRLAKAENISFQELIDDVDRFQSD